MFISFRHGCLMFDGLSHIWLRNNFSFGHHNTNDKNTLTWIRISCRNFRCNHLCCLEWTTVTPQISWRTGNCHTIESDKDILRKLFPLLLMLLKHSDRCVKWILTIPPPIDCVWHRKWFIATHINYDVSNLTNINAGTTGSFCVAGDT